MTFCSCAPPSRIENAFARHLCCPQKSCSCQLSLTTLKWIPFSAVTLCGCADKWRSEHRVQRAHPRSTDPKHWCPCQHALCLLKWLRDHPATTPHVRSRHVTQRKWKWMGYPKRMQERKSCLEAWPSLPTGQRGRGKRPNHVQQQSSTSKAGPTRALAPRCSRGRRESD